MSQQNQNQNDPRNGGETSVAQAIQENTSVENYEGVFSDIHEFHSAEWGLLAGIVIALTQVAPELGAVAAMVSGIKGVSDIRRDGPPAFVVNNASYAVVFLGAGYGAVQAIFPFVA